MGIVTGIAYSSYGLVVIVNPYEGIEYGEVMEFDLGDEYVELGIEITEGYGGPQTQSQKSQEALSISTQSFLDTLFHLCPPLCE